MAQHEEMHGRRRSHHRASHLSKRGRRVPHRMVDVEQVHLWEQLQFRTQRLLQYAAIQSGDREQFLVRRGFQQPRHFHSSLQLFRMAERSSAADAGAW